MHSSLDDQNILQPLEEKKFNNDETNEMKKKLQI